MPSGRMFRTAVRVGAKTVGAATVGGGTYGGYLYQTDEGSRRAILAYSSFVPVVLHYRWLEARSKNGSWLGVTDVTDADWDALDQMYAAPTVKRIGELQGMYCKYGQTAAGLTNTFSDRWIAELRTLEDQVPPRDFDVIRQTVEEETGKALEETFEAFDPTPLGSASIGQVHRARYQGKDVAVKVQYAESERVFREDMRTIRAFCARLAPEQLVVLDSLEKQNATEIDYRIEAQNLKEVRSNMVEAGFCPSEVEVPRPIAGTNRVLVMDLLDGPKLNDGIRSFYAEWAQENGTTLEALEAEAKERIEKEGIPAKYDGPSAAQLESYRRYRRTRDNLYNLGVAIYNRTLGNFGLSKATPRPPAVLPPNTPRIIDVLMRVHGHQLLKNGVFNADPHGGNFLLMPDGRVGLIDYGATKRLTEKERLTACVLYAALHRGDEKTLFDMASIGGFRSKYGNREVLMKLMRFAYDSYGRDVTGNRNIQQFIDDLKRQDPWTETPDNYVMAQFMSLRLRSVALGMNHPVRCAEWWGPLAERILQEEGHPYESWDRAKLLQFRPDIRIHKQDWG